MAGTICSLIVMLILCGLWVVYLWHHQHPLQPHRVATTRQRLLKPRTPVDCPACRRQLALPPCTPGRATPVRPGRELKSRRGAPKRSATDGFACPNHACASYRITDASVHALVGDGCHFQR